MPITGGLFSSSAQPFCWKTWPTPVWTAAWSSATDFFRFSYFW